MGLDWRTVDWNDWSYSGEVSDRIAELLGWQPFQNDRQKWWDPHDQSETEFFTFNAREGKSFDPFNEIEDAIVAASRLADRLKIVFHLERFLDRQWRASFSMNRRDGGSSGIQPTPYRAICEAILKAGDNPDPRSLFRKTVAHEAPQR